LFYQSLRFGIKTECKKVSASVLQFYICAKRSNAMLFPMHTIADKFSNERLCSKHVLIYNKIVNENNFFYIFFTDSTTLVCQDITDLVVTSKTLTKDFEFFKSISIKDFSDIFDFIKKHKYIPQINIDESLLVNLKINFEENHFYNDIKFFDICRDYLAIGESKTFCNSQNSFHFSNVILRSLKHLKDRRICIRNFVRDNTDHTILAIKTIEADLPQITVVNLGVNIYREFVW